MRNIKDNIKTIGDLETKNITANKIVVNDAITDDKQVTTKKYVNDEINTTKQAITQETDTKLATKADKTTVNSLTNTVNTNTANTTANTINIATNKADIKTCKINIRTNTTNIDTNKKDIENNENRLEYFVGALQDLQHMCTANENNIKTNIDNIAKNASDIKTLSNSISAITTKLNNLEITVTDNTSKINDKITDITNEISVTSSESRAVFECVKILKFKSKYDAYILVSFRISNYNPRWGRSWVNIGVSSNCGVATINSTGGSKWERENAINCTVYPDSPTRLKLEFPDDKDIQDLYVMCLLWI